MERARQFLLDQKFLSNSDHKPLEFIFNPQKELPKVTLLYILRWAIKLMTFNFYIEYVKGSTILYVDALSWLKFNNEKKEINNLEDEILHWVETDILPYQRLRTETLQDPILNNVYWRIKRNRWNNCSKACSETL